MYKQTHTKLTTKNEYYQHQCLNKDNLSMYITVITIAPIFSMHIYNFL